jgi:RNA polymerase sigma factor FliA
LVLKHADLVKRIAYHLVSRMPPNVEVDDLIQSGMIGLLDAAKHYSATKGANFETYAGIRIRGAMLDEVRKSDWTPRSVHRNMREDGRRRAQDREREGPRRESHRHRRGARRVDRGIPQVGAGRGELPAVQLRSNGIER